jgi:hypothetical protein
MFEVLDGAPAAVATSAAAVERWDYGPAAAWGQAAGTVAGLLVVPLVGMSYLSLVKRWGYVNGLCPYAAGLALAGAEMMQGVWWWVKVGTARKAGLSKCPHPCIRSGLAPAVEAQLQNAKSACINS